jgi:hypothetical protein
MTLLQAIQAAATDSSVDLGDLLRKCKILAAKLRHADFALWVTRELNGYEDEANVPTYRHVTTLSRGNFGGPTGPRLENVQIPIHLLDADLRALATTISFTQSVSALAEMLRNAEQDLSAPWPSDAISHCQRHVRMFDNGMLLQHAWLVIPRASVRAVVDTVKTRVLDFALAIEQDAPDAGELPPGAEAPLASERIQFIFETTIQNGQAVIEPSAGLLSVSDVSFSPAVPAVHHEAIRAQLGTLTETLRHAPRADLEDGADALAKIQRELVAAQPDTARIERYLSVLANITTVASNAHTVLQALTTSLNTIAQHAPSTTGSA